MVIIRLSRSGVRKNPFYRIVAVDERVKSKGKFLDVLGYWFPSKKDISIDKKGVEKWVKIGAKISPAVAKLIKS